MLLFALGWSHWFFMLSLSLLSIFMVLVILVQRGRGGGLTGALGGMGGQSAFGTKAGDLFTRITIVVAAIWVLLAMAALKMLNPHEPSGFNRSLRGQVTQPIKTGEGGLLPSTTKSATPTTDQSGESTPTGSAPAEAPAASPATPPATTDAAPAAPSEGKSSESAKP